MIGLQRQIRLLIAVIAIAAVLSVLLVSHAYAGHSTVWLAILPVFFLGLAFPLRAPSRVADLGSGRARETFFLRISFQRPPPALLG